jgi:N4-(beta-N-acetylglucosaminyl)-L-asparaginase
MSPKTTRRSFLAGAASLAVPATLAARGKAPGILVRRAGPIAIASANGKAAVNQAVLDMLSGHAPVDAAVRAVGLVEDDPKDMSVGYGGLPNADGIVELDSCCMDGPSHLAGAVASLRNIQNPAQVALKVLRRTDHVLLVGEGALRFARLHGFEEKNLLTEAARKRWLAWKERLSDSDDYIAPGGNELPKPREGGDQRKGEGKDGGKDSGKNSGKDGGKDEREVRRSLHDDAERPTGTIHLSARNGAGDFGACTTTSGLAYKIPGRVGDSPLIGCGLYVDNDIGSAGSTGRGEAAILSNGSHTIIELLRQGKHPTDACLELLRRIAHYTRIPRLLRPDGRPNFNVRFYAIDKQGRYGSASLYAGPYAVATEDGAELKTGAGLFE